MGSGGPAKKLTNQPGPLGPFFIGKEAEGTTARGCISGYAPSDVGAKSGSAETLRVDCRRTTRLKIETDELAPPKVRHLVRVKAEAIHPVLRKKQTASFRKRNEADGIFTAREEIGNFRSPNAHPISTQL